MKLTKPVAILISSLAAPAAYADFTGSGNATRAGGTQFEIGAGVSNFAGAPDGNQILLDMFHQNEQGSIEINFTGLPNGFDMVLHVGDFERSTATDTITVQTITLWDGNAGSGDSRVFTLSTPITLNFTNAVAVGALSSVSDTTATSTANVLTGSGTLSNYTTNTMFGTIASISIQFVLNQSGVSLDTAFQLDAITMATPEPATIGFFGLGAAFGGAWVLSRRRSARRDR